MIRLRAIGTCCLLLLLWPVAAWSQSVQGGAGFLYAGQSIWPGAASAIHEVSKPAPLLPNDRYTMIGAEAYYRRNRWLVGINASALANKQSQATGTPTTIESSASNVHLWIGWVAWQTKRTKLYPCFGPGINSVNVNTTAANGTTTIYVLDGFATDIGLTVDWFALKADTEPTLHAGTLLSLRAGYRLTTASAEWHSDHSGTSLLTPTRFSPHGFYLTLGIGGGGFRSR
jgi:hypothetical protein